MVTEGGIYILTLFDDFAGTYGKLSKSDLNCDAERSEIYGLNFSTVDFVHHRNVGYFLRLWYGQFLYRYQTHA
jgi:hypothetical protein